MKVVAIIQARIGSTRLPGKVLLPICGRPMIQHVIERAQAIPGVDHVTLAVPEEELAEFYVVRAVTGCGLAWGPRDDVLARYVEAAKWDKPDVIVRITGDCPLIAPEVCREVLEAVKHGFAFASNDTQTGNTVRSGYPDGLDCECFTAEMLERTHREATKAADREHVTPWLLVHAPSKLVVSAEPRAWPKLSVDTQADLDRVRRIMAHIPAGEYSWVATKKAIEEAGLC